MRLLLTILFLNFIHQGLAQSEVKFNDQIAAQILAVNREMEREFNQKNYAKIAEFYTQDAVMVGNRIELSGKDELTEFWGNFGALEQWTLENIQITPLGPETALQRGYSIMTYRTEEGDLRSAKSLFSLIWIKKEEGWKILLDHFSQR